jgi:isochorismate hydrolase
MTDTKKRAPKFVLEPKKSALIVVDMQDFFLSPESRGCIANNETVIKNVRKLIELYKSKNLPIIFTLHIGNEKSLMNKWWSNPLFKENPLSRINSELLKEVEGYKNYEILEKPEYDAFYQTDLEKILKEKHVSQVVICGILTHLCCDISTRSAFMRGFEPFVPADGTESFKQEFKDASLLNLGHGFAIINSINDIKEAINHV